MTARDKAICRLYTTGQSSLAVGAAFRLSSAQVLRILERAGIARRSPQSGLSTRRGVQHPMYGRRHTAEAKERMGAPKRAQGGERSLTTDGYIRVQAPGHPEADSAGYVREHRLVVERRVGRYLLPSEVVHHINGIRTDNRDENLHLCSSVSEHSKIHARTSGRPSMHEGPAEGAMSPVVALAEKGGQ